MNNTVNTSNNDMELTWQDSKAQQHLIESLQQELHESKRTLSRYEFMKDEMENEIDRLQQELIKLEKKETLSAQNKEAGLIAQWSEKVNSLQTLLNDEQDRHKEDISKLKSEIEELKKNSPSNDETISYDAIKDKMSALVSENEELTKAVKDLHSQLESSSPQVVFLTQKVHNLEDELDGTKDLLKSKKEELRTLNETLKDLQEDKATIESELATLKVGPIGEIHRGNSLFAEVEDRRQGMESKMTILKNKYAQAKRIIGNKNAEIAKLKTENNKMQRFWPEEEKQAKLEKSKLNEEYRKRIEFLESRVRTLEKKPDSPTVVTISTKNLCELGWVHVYIEEVRAENRKLQSQLEENSVQKLFLAESLHSTQLEVRALKVQSLEDKAACLQLQLELDKLKGSETIVPEVCNKKNDYPESDIVKVKEKGQKNVRFADSDNAAVSQIN